MKLCQSLNPEEVDWGLGKKGSPECVILKLEVVPVQANSQKMVPSLPEIAQRI